jgi:hypothetical protein
MTLKQAQERYYLNYNQALLLINSPESPTSLKIDGKRLIPIDTFDEYFYTKKRGKL